MSPELPIISAAFPKRQILAATKKGKCRYCALAIVPPENKCQLIKTGRIDMINKRIG
jgi:hypothetical protein